MCGVNDPDECQCLPATSGLDIPTDAERFPLGSLSCAGLSVFLFLIDFFGMDGKTKNKKNIFFLGNQTRQQMDGINLEGIPLILLHPA